MTKNSIVQMLELHPKVEWTLRLPTPEEKRKAGGTQRLDFVLDLGEGATLYMSLDEAKEVLEYAAPRPEREVAGIEVTRTESYVVEYNTIVAIILNEYNEVGRFPESKAQCEEWVGNSLDFGDAILIKGDHPKREEAEALVQSFYTDFENRIW